jgi:hypothetical protein
MQNKPTGDLLKDLKVSDDPVKFINENKQYMIDSDLGEHLKSMLAEKDMKKSDVLKRAEINEIYGYQLFAGTRKPSRDKLISLCSGMQLTLEQTQQLLKYAGLAPLYPKNERDCIIITGISSNAPVYKINEMLFDNKFNTLD